MQKGINYRICTSSILFFLYSSENHFPTIRLITNKNHTVLRRLDSGFLSDRRRTVQFLFAYVSEY